VVLLSSLQPEGKNELGGCAKSLVWLDWWAKPIPTILFGSSFSSIPTFSQPDRKSVGPVIGRVGVVLLGKDETHHPGTPQPEGGFHLPYETGLVGQAHPTPLRMESVNNVLDEA